MWPLHFQNTSQESLWATHQNPSPESSPSPSPDRNLLSPSSSSSSSSSSTFFEAHTYMYTTLAPDRKKNINYLPMLHSRQVPTFLNAADFLWEWRIRENGLCPFLHCTELHCIVLYCITSHVWLKGLMTGTHVRYRIESSCAGKTSAPFGNSGIWDLNYCHQERRTRKGSLNMDEKVFKQIQWRSGHRWNARGSLKAFLLRIIEFGVNTRRRWPEDFTGRTLRDDTPFTRSKVVSLQDKLGVIQ